MKVKGLTVGTRLEDTRRGVVMTIIGIDACGSCPCGWGEIHYIESGGRRRTKTFHQFENLRFVRNIVDEQP